MVLSPKSKRRRGQVNDDGIPQQQQQQQQHATPSQSSRREPQQQQSQNLCMSNSNSYTNHLHRNNTESDITTQRPPQRKTVVVLDALHNDPSPVLLPMSQAESSLNHNSSFHSLSSVQSSATYASAREFMIDCETDFSNNLSAEEDNNIFSSNHVTSAAAVGGAHDDDDAHDNDKFSESIIMATPMSTTNPNDASNSTGVTARKSSEASSSNGSGSSTSRTGHPSTVTRRQPNDSIDDHNNVHHKTNYGNHLNSATTIPNERKDVTWQDHSEFHNDNADIDNSEIKLTGWKVFVETISNVPDDEYYTKHCTSSYDILQKTRTTLGYAVSNHVVQTVIVILIIINALQMGVATFDFVTEDPEVLRIFSIVDLIFLIIFTIELGLQLFYHGISLFYDAWLLFDFIIIVLSWSLQSIQIIRAFRIFRALRLVARLQVLRELITALASVMPRMYAISMLLFLIFYIFAVLFTQLFGELELSGNYFSTLDASLFTCMNMMTLEWINVTREVMTHQSWAWAPITSFISITGFIVYNLVVAVVCDAVAVLDRKKQQEADAAQKVIDDMKYAVTQKDQMHATQHRFEELSNGIERMKQQHMTLCQTVDMLTSELQQSMIVIANLQQQLSQSQPVKKRW